MSLFSLLCSVEGEAPSSETGTSLDSPSAYHQGPLVPGSSLSPDHYEHTSVGAYGLYAGPGPQQRTRRPRLQHSTSVLRKQAEEEAIKRSRSLSESYELSSDLQDKQVGGRSLFPLCMTSQVTQGLSCQMLLVMDSRYQLGCPSEDEGSPAFTSSRAFSSPALLKHGKGFTLMARGTGVLSGDLQYWLPFWELTVSSSNVAFVALHIPHC